MVRSVALAARSSRDHRALDVLRAVIVSGCALALILAEAPTLF